jgi:L-amino acid N-acyltransferase YncA
MSPSLRDAIAADLDRINAIYNFYVEHSTCTYQEAPSTTAERQAWFERHGPHHPVIVAEVDGRVVGWGALSPFHARSAYRFTVEDSVYVDDAWRGRGIGRRLLEELVARARAIGYHTIIAGVDASQPGSLALHARHGFERVAHLSEVGFKFGRWLDVIYLQLKLP